MTAQRDRVRLLLGVAAVLGVGVLGSTSVVSPYWRFLLTEMAILALLATSFNLVYGFGGMLSFCQGTFYGLGAYVTAWLVLHAVLHPVLVLVAAFLGGGVVAGVVGLLMVRMGGHSFTIASVILAVVSLLSANTFREFTGGEDGLALTGIGSDLAAFGISPELIRFYLALGILAGVMAALRSFLRSTSGRIVIAIRENEVRARFLGYDVRRWRLGLFSCAGALAGLAGGLYAVAAGHVSTATLDIGLSVNAILWSVVGGVGTVAGPLLGIALLLPVTDFLSSRLAAVAQIPIGVLLIVVITVMPDGILGWFRTRWLEKRAAMAPGEAEMVQLAEAALVTKRRNT